MRTLGIGGAALLAGSVPGRADAETVTYAADLRPVDDAAPAHASGRIAFAVRTVTDLAGRRRRVVNYDLRVRGVDDFVDGHVTLENGTELVDLAASASGDSSDRPVREKGDRVRLTGTITDNEIRPNVPKPRSAGAVMSVDDLEQVFAGGDAIVSIRIPERLVGAVR